MPPGTRKPPEKFRVSEKTASNMCARRRRTREAADLLLKPVMGAAGPQLRLGPAVRLKIVERREAQLAERPGEYRMAKERRSEAESVRVQGGVVDFE